MKLTKAALPFILIIVIVFVIFIVIGFFRGLGG